MQKFTDATGMAWALHIDVPTRERIQKQTEFDVYAAIDPKELLKLDEPRTLVAVLYVVCEDQIKREQLTPEQFAARFHGDAIDEASDALIKAILDFFPKRRREMLAAYLTKSQSLQSQAHGELLKTIDKMSFDSIAQSMLSGLSSRPPQSQESTQPSAALRSDNSPG